MSEKTIRVYDGLQYKDVTYEDILDGNGNPTGRYKTIKEEPVTILGTYLDIEENCNQLKADVEALQTIKTGDYSTYTHRFYLFTDGQKKHYLLSKDYYLYPPEERQVNSLFNWLISILKKEEWYLNNGEDEVYTKGEYKLNDSLSIKYIKFNITPKDGSSSFAMYLIPMDNCCYKLT